MFLQQSTYIWPTGVCGAPHSCKVNVWGHTSFEGPRGRFMEDVPTDDRSHNALGLLSKHHVGSSPGLSSQQC